jgi:hypothetical protein
MNLCFMAMIWEHKTHSDGSNTEAPHTKVKPAQSEACSSKYS